MSDTQFVLTEEIAFNHVAEYMDDARDFVNRRFSSDVIYGTPFEDLFSKAMLKLMDWYKKKCPIKEDGHKKITKKFIVTSILNNFKQAMHDADNETDAHNYEEQIKDNMHNTQFGTRETSQQKRNELIDLMPNQCQRIAKMRLDGKTYREIQAQLDMSAREIYKKKAIMQQIAEENGYDNWTRV